MAEPWGPAQTLCKSLIMSKGNIPIIDLFAGPGGLGEGFSCLKRSTKKVFDIKLSIEKDPTAHETLTLRAFFRQLRDNRKHLYYSYLKGQVSKEDLFQKCPAEIDHARDEARLMTLGKDDPTELIRSRVNGAKHWVLIGGPPCQAYSLVGRSKMLGTIKREQEESQKDYETRRQIVFNEDPRHTLYLEYLKIIADHQPSIFVMENVRGILSSKHNGERIFPTILSDLKNPSIAVSYESAGQKYKLFSLTTEKQDDEEFSDKDYLIHSEEYGIPQKRHRVIILGIRADLNVSKIPALKKTKMKVTVKDVIGDLPKLTSGVSRNTAKSVKSVLNEISNLSGSLNYPAFAENTLSKNRLKQYVRSIPEEENRGVHFQRASAKPNDWYYDQNLEGVCNHQTRSHMKEDLWRYLFCSAYGVEFKKSPHLKNFPEQLLPKHKNVKEAIKSGKFGDRFRVQVANEPSNTITSHISKDGHYFIHYDPSQCRSLTVREAARIQTFPDNYFFEGNRTSQYHQVGNAVPPKLAYQIADIVAEIISKIDNES